MNDKQNDGPTESVQSVGGGSEWDAEQMSHSSNAQRQAGPGTSENLASQDEWATSTLEIAALLALAFGLPSLPVVVLCLVLAGAAIGNSARLRIPLWPGLLHPGMSVALCNDKAGRLSQVSDLLLQPFRDFRDAQGLNTAGDNQPTRASQAIGPILEEDPPAGYLAKTLTLSPDSSVLVVHHESGLRLLLDATCKPAGVNDLRVLDSGYLGRTVSVTTGKSDAIQLITQPAVAWILDGSPDLLARIFQRGDPLLERVAGHLLCLAAPETVTATPEPGNLAAALEVWGSFIRELLGLRASRSEYLLQFPAEAAKSFQQLRWNQMGKNPALGLGLPRFTKDLPANTAKLTLCGALLQNRPAQLSVSMMDKTIALAQKLAADTEALAAALESEGQRLALEKKAPKMLQVLSQIGRSKPSELRRHFDQQAKEIHDPVVEHLIAKGRVRRYPDGTIEVVA